jgi:peptidoglycan/LPS O-acetylase OafA/YrhL
LGEQPVYREVSPFGPRDKGVNVSVKQLIALLGVAAVLGGNFLEFFKFLFVSESLWDNDDGKIVLVAGILAAIAVLLRWNVAAIVMCLVAAAVAAWDMIDSNDKGFDLGIGGYVIIAGAVVAIIGAAAAIGDKRKTAQSTEETA